MGNLISLEDFLRARESLEPQLKPKTCLLCRKQDVAPLPEGWQIIYQYQPLVDCMCEDCRSVAVGPVRWELLSTEGIQEHMGEEGV